MYLNGLDELDQKIIQLLIENARISYSDIGKETGISRVAVKARIQALEKQGIIEEYTTIINPQKISGAVSCYFEIEIKPDHLSQVTDILHNNDTVTQIYRVIPAARQDPVIPSSEKSAGKYRSKRRKRRHPLGGACRRFPVCRLSQRRFSLFGSCQKQRRRTGHRNK